MTTIKLNDLRLLTDAAKPRRGGEWGYLAHGLAATHREWELQHAGLVTIDRHLDRDRRRVKITAQGLLILASRHPAVMPAGISGARRPAKSSPRGLAGGAGDGLNK